MEQSGKSRRGVQQTDCTWRVWKRETSPEFWMDQWYYPPRTLGTQVDLKGNVGKYNEFLLTRIVCKLRTIRIEMQDHPGWDVLSRDQHRFQQQRLTGGTWIEDRAGCGQWGWLWGDCKV